MSDLNVRKAVGRKYKKQWETEHPWLMLKDNECFCKLCHCTLSQFKKHNLVMHEKSTKHKNKDSKSCHSITKFIKPKTVVSGNKRSCLKVGDEFSSAEEMLSAIKQYEDETKTTYWTRDSRSLISAQSRGRKIPNNPEVKYYYISFHCNFGGRTYMCKSNGKRCRQGTNKIGCKAAISIKSTEDARKLVVQKIERDHNHQILEENYRYLPKCRRLNHKEQDEVKEILKTKPNMKSLLCHIHEKYEKNVTLKDLQNMSTKWKKDHAQKCKAASELCKKICSLVSEQSMDVFKEWMHFLRKVLHRWKEGKNISCARSDDATSEREISESEMSDDMNEIPTEWLENYPYLPKCRRLNHKEQDEVKEILKAKPSMKSSLCHIHEKYEKNITLKDLQNLPSKSKEGHAQKYKAASELCKKISSLVSEQSMDVLKERMQFLHQIFVWWKKGVDISWLRSDDATSEHEISENETSESETSESETSESEMSDDMNEIPNEWLSPEKLSPKIQRSGHEEEFDVARVDLAKEGQVTSYNKPKTFKEKDVLEKDKCMLMWFVEEHAANACLQTNKTLTRADVQSSCNVHHACRDKSVTLSKIVKYFSPSGWNAICTAVSKVKAMPWMCDVCNKVLGDNQVSCDGCLSRLHWSCANANCSLKTIPWFCSSCYFLA